MGRMIVFEDVTKRYSTSKAGVSNLNIQIKEREFVTLVGHSGAGKTTILKLILGEERPNQGRVMFHGQQVNRRRRGRMTKLRRKMGVVFQDFRLLPNKTAYENVAFAMEAAERPGKEIRSDVPYALDLVGLNQKANSFPNELSGGEKQRVAIARAIVNQPDLLIADEPTGNLDPVNTYEIIQILKKINELGTTIILTTHNKGVVDEIGSRVITMQDGKVLRDDSQGNYLM